MPSGYAHLSVHDLHAFYGESHILHGVTFTVPRGEVVTLLGRNGAGKTTTLRAIMGLISSRRGSIAFDGVETIAPALASHRAPGDRATARRSAASSRRLNVRENLMLPPVVKPGGMSVEEVYELFPRLKERSTSQGTKLSGGEQQMLAIARILRTGAKLLLLDEPTEGLAPVIVQHIGEIIRTLKKRGFTVLLVEQNFHFAATVADRHFVVEHGQVIDMIENSQLAANKQKLEGYLGV